LFFFKKKKGIQVLWSLFMGSIGTYAVFLPLAAQADFLNKS
jgi:hypothetical protein